MNEQDNIRAMNAWPTLYIPGISDPLPILHLKASRGLVELEQRERFDFYVCGITPYDATHLGHAATYVAFDLINRYMRLRGAETHFVENITDIDEPLLERAERDRVNWQELAASQISLFQSDMTALHVIPPDFFVPATSVMPLVDRAIAQMDRNGFVYRLHNDLYFDISSFIHELPLPLENAITAFAEKGGDPERSGKKHPLDPILWWGHKDGEPGWESSHGFGRPGWHIECAVIALRYLLGSDYLDQNEGEFSIDLQGGGSDLLFPHHFMSAAQGRALLGRPFARDFVHAGMVGLNGEKMSKSKGNLIFVSTLLQSGVDPMVIRYALLQDHYQADRMWTDHKLESAATAVSRIRLALAQQDGPDVKHVIREIIEAIANNLDTPAALTALENWADRVLSGSWDRAQSSGNLSRLLDGLLGLAL